MVIEGNYLGLIPARGGSKGVERKNIKPLGGQPLIAHTVEAASESNKLDRTIVSTDATEIRNVAIEYGGEAPFLRPPELATDEASMDPVVQQAIAYLEEEEGYPISSVVLLQPTSPLRTSTHIDSAIERHSETDVTTVISVYKDYSYRWRQADDGAQQLNYTGDATRRQDKSTEYVENGAIYIIDVDQFLAHGSIRSGHVGLFEMDERRSVDIDTEFDFWLCEQLIQYLDSNDSNHGDIGSGK